MDDAKWERAAGAGGILFVVLVLVSALLPGAPPSTSDPALKIAKYFTDHSDAIREASFLGIIATVPIVWWAAAMYRMLDRATGNARLGVMAVVGVAIATAAAGVSSVIFAVVAMAGVTGSGGVAGTKFYYLLGTNLTSLVAIGTALVVGSVSAGILRSGMMPKWIAWLGVLVTVLSVGGSLIGVSGNDAVMGVLFASFLTFSLWLVVVSIVMLRKPATA
jgi:hypothetical protein